LIADILAWFGNTENSGPLMLGILFPAFIFIVIYVFTGKKRKERLESYRDIPFADDDRLDPNKQQHNEQVNKDESTGR